MRLKLAIIKKIKILRKKGKSIPEISKDCGVSRSTALRYANKVKISPKYYQRWLDRRNASKIISKRNWDIAAREVNSLIDNIELKDWMLIAASLYWAEGSKKDLSFSNTDSRMIRVFISILKNVFNIKDEDFKISLRIYEDLNKNRCIKYWSSITNLKLDNKTTINILKGSKKGKLQYGMCRIRIRKGGLLLKKLFSIINRIDDCIRPRSSTDRTMHS